MKISDYLPYTREGRQTLVYLSFAGAGPILTVIVVWAMRAAERLKLFDTFANLAYILASGLLVLVISLGMFVSLRALKVSKDGIEATGGENDQ